jgi:hypothetical protein
MAILFLTVPNSIRLLRRDFGFKEVAWRFDPDVFPDLIPAVAPGALSADGAAPHLPDSRGHLGETAIADIIISRQFLAPPAWPSCGPIERWLWRLLNNRERALAEFIFPGGVRLSASWLSIFRMMLVAAAAGLFAGLASDTAKYWIIGIGFGIAAIRVLAAFLGTGSAFTPVPSSGVNIHRYAGFGIGFDELSKFLLKLSLAQLPALMGFTLAVALMVSWFAHLPPLFATGAAFRLAFLLLASRLILIPCRISACTNDTSKIRMSALLIILGGAVSICLFLALGFFTVILPSWAGWLACGLAALDAFALFCFYRWFYHRNSFDLMSLPQR